jgi:hypothetical protein
VKVEGAQSRTLVIMMLPAWRCIGIDTFATLAPSRTTQPRRRIAHHHIDIFFAARTTETFLQHAKAQNVSALTPSGPLPCREWC